jgi:hypothetical protein
MLPPPDTPIPPEPADCSYPPDLPPPAGKAGEYLALGDSYSSGEGAPLYLSHCDKSYFLAGTERETTKSKALGTGSVGCHRSLAAWPATVARHVSAQFDFSFHACSGSVITDVAVTNHSERTERPQQDWISDRTKLVTFTFGGNDAGFAETMLACASPVTPRNNPTVDPSNPAGPCTRAILRAQRMVAKLGMTKRGDSSRPPTGYRDLFDDLKARGPADMRMVVVGYPRLFPEYPPSKCGTGGARNFTREQMLTFNAVARSLDDNIAEGTAKAGVDYVDVYDVMSGVDVCTNKGNMINRVIPTNSQWSFHPTVGGQDRIAARVIACIDDRTRCGPHAPTTFKFQPFGLTRGEFGLESDGDSLNIIPPSGSNRYAALWGGYLSGQWCDVNIDFDLRTSEPSAGNFGVGVAPRARIEDDQPAGMSVQYEHRSPPDFTTTESALRLAHLPAGAYSDSDILPAPDLNSAHHVHLRASGNELAVDIDYQKRIYVKIPKACGGVAIRAWGANVDLDNIRITAH